MANRNLHPIESSAWQENLRRAQQFEIAETFYAQFPMYEGAKNICLRLQESGFVAWFAGGCVRDLFLQREPRDFDIVTNALPEDVESLFSRTEGVGKSFGVILVIEEGEVYDVATFRKDGDYKDGRRPESIEWSTAEEDAKRRDFTLNALFYDPFAQKAYDFVGGVADLEAQRIVVVGDPHARFSEDYLRVLRALRFRSELGFQIADNVVTAIAEVREGLMQVAHERIKDEIFKLLQGAFANHAVNLLLQLRLSEWCLTPGQVSTATVSSLDWRFWQEAESRPVHKLFGLWLLWMQDLAQGESWLRLWPFSQRERQTWQGMREGFLQEPAFSTLPTAQKFVRLQNSNYALGLGWRELLGRGADATFGELSRKFNEVWGGKLPEPLIGGRDVLFLQGSLRGRALEEVYSVQLEGLISHRDEAIQWLRDHYPSE